jgi:hypothetical protein
MWVWSEEEFKKRISLRAAELKISVTQLLRTAGVHKDTFFKDVASRRLDTFIKLAEACQWTLAQVIGLNVLGRIDLDLSLMAYQTANRVMLRLPREAQNDIRLIAFHGYVYDALVERQQHGRVIDANILGAYEEILFQTWEGRSPDRVEEPA